jgi:hypothetical protein
MSFFLLKKRSKTIICFAFIKFKELPSLMEQGFYKLTSWRGVFLENLFVAQPVEITPLSCGTRGLIIVYTRVRHSIQS